MKHMLMTAVLGLSVATAMAHDDGKGALRVATVTAPANECFFNTNCTNVAQEYLTPIVIPLTGSNGVLRTRVLQADTNAPAAGYHGYEYTLDLAGILIDTNHPVCLTNLVECRTNRTEVYTNKVTCRTNLVGVVKAVTCVTNRIPATNILTCITNFVPGTNIVVCHTNSAGVTCVTNVFPPTNYVVCATTRFPARKFVTCQTNIFDPGHLVVQCWTNRIKVPGEVVTCRTSLVHCPGSPPCLTSLSLKVAQHITPADYDGDGTNDDVYVVIAGTNATNAAVSPVAIERDGSKLTLRFDPPLCAGQASVTVGFVSTAPPRNVEAKLRYTGGDKSRTVVVGPKLSELGHCDFGDLAAAIAGLRTRDFTGSSDAVREERRALLLAQVQAAALAAVSDDEDGVLNALGAVITRANGGNNDWVTRDGADKIEDELEELLECVKHATDDDDEDDD